MALHSRLKRVNEEVRNALAAIIMEDLKDPRVTQGMVTVSSVEVSPDLHTAQVWVSVYGTDEESAAALEGLNHSRGFLRHQLRERVILKYLPELVFHLDPSFRYADRINRLLKEIEPKADDETEP